jgi:acyl-CoA reductase-like NAD-dependent aldehyde dehydrogenase
MLNDFYLLSHSDFYPEGDPSKPGVCSRLISQQATIRIGNMLQKTQGKIVFGGNVDKETRYVAPTVVRDVPVNDSLMSE